MLSCRYVLESAQERDQIGFLLRRQNKAKTAFIKAHDIQQGLSGAVMEIWAAGRETAQNWPLYLANMVEFAIDQSLAESGSRLAIDRRHRRVRWLNQCGTGDVRAIDETEVA